MEQVQLSEDEILDNFCHMVLEEYLIKREMRNTLKTFREEWNRPKEVRPLTIKNIRPRSYIVSRIQSYIPGMI